MKDNTCYMTTFFPLKNKLNANMHKIDKIRKNIYWCICMCSLLPFSVKFQHLITSALDCTKAITAENHSFLYT